MNEKQQELSARLEEYKELRAEVRDCLAAAQHNRYFAFTITLAVIGTSSLVAQPYLLFLATATLVAVLWYNDLVRMRSIFRLMTYVELEIEPKVPGLNWGHLIRKNLQRRTTPGMAFLGRSDFAIQFLFHAILSLVLLWHLSFWGTIFAGVGLVLVFGLLSRESLCMWSKGREQERKYWQDIITEKNVR